MRSEYVLLLLVLQLLLLDDYVKEDGTRKDLLFVSVSNSFRYVSSGVYGVQDFHLAPIPVD